MIYQTINPYNEKKGKVFQLYNSKEIERRVALSATAFYEYKKTHFNQRSRKFNTLASILKKKKKEYALLITEEMGKILKEAEAEIEKCAWVCEYYSENASSFLAEKALESNAKEAYVSYQPLGTVLAIMPWNFPFWQLFRFAAPAVMAGNTVLLKHAPNVPQCALAIEKLFQEAGFPEGIVQNLFVDNDQVAKTIGSSHVRAVTLTGSTRAGGQVASIAGKNIKKTVLELGGSDPFIVMEDADIERAVENAVKSRLMNAGQSCIAAKRFIVHDSVYDNFTKKLVSAFKQKVCGDPTNENTTLAPLARPDLVDNLQKQVDDAMDKGATCLIGGIKYKEKGYFFEPTVLTNIPRNARAYTEELFGPVASVYKYTSHCEMIDLANCTSYGLGASLWTNNKKKALNIIPEIASGSVFVNQMTASDPRLPFGGIKNSGYGRELSEHGIKEFVNAKTISLD